MSTKVEQAAYLIFENDMKLRMKPHLLYVKETEGQEEYYQKIRNCRKKWKCMTKELKANYLAQAREIQQNEEQEESNNNKKDNTRGERKTKAAVNRVMLPRSGWDVFREENHQEVVNDGFSGKEIAAQLGKLWSQVSRSDKKVYGFKAHALKGVREETSEELERSSTVHKNVGHTCIPLVKHKSI
eukprot:GFUD01063433.1.p1 GENE.GFUD01063433.1~~GFUD01063433.1.p1  ORF type:complete len:185 (-),score=51.89 GFUD01063433.1:64-618(-)